MSELSKSEQSDLESSRTGVHPYVPNDMQYRAYELIVFELRCIRELLSNSLVEQKKIRNKLWNIEDVLSNPKNEPEYDISEEER